MTFLNTILAMEHININAEDPKSVPGQHVTGLAPQEVEALLHKSP